MGGQGFLVAIDPRAMVREHLASLKNEFKHLYPNMLSFSAFSDFLVEHLHCEKKIGTVILGVGTVTYAEKTVEQLRQTLDAAVPIVLLGDHFKLAMLELLFRKHLAGYLTLHNSCDDYFEILRHVLEGKRPVSQHIGEIHFVEHARLDMHDWIGSPHFFRLSRRETELFGHLVEGRDLYDCARIMGLTVKSAENLKTRLMQKLDVHSTARLILLGVKFGLGPH